jgi:hypothetical protein
VIFVSLWLPQAKATAELVYTADGRTIYGQVRPGAAAGTVVIGGTDGAQVTLPQEEVSSIEFRSATEPPQQAGVGRSPAPTVLLRNGDRLSGSLRQLWPPVLGHGTEIVTVPVSWVSILQVKSGGDIPAGGDHDAVELLNGDRVEGRVEGYHSGRLHVSTSVGVLNIDPARIRRVVLSRGDPPLEPAPGIQAVLETSEGERLTGEWLEITSTEIRLKPPWGPALAVPRERALRLSVLNGRLVFLSDLHPTEVEESSYFDTPHPYQLDHSQGGRPLRLGGRVYSRGLGVHARSALTYAVVGSYKKFEATVGVDSEVGNGGSVVFRVMGDDRTLFQSPVLHGGEAPASVSVDVSGVVLLRLEVDEADSGDIADHADWAEARLFK